MSDFCVDAQLGNKRLIRCQKSEIGELADELPVCAEYFFA